MIYKHEKLGKAFGNEIMAFIDIRIHEQTIFACVLGPTLKLDDL